MAHRNGISGRRFKRLAPAMAVIALAVGSLAQTGQAGAVTTRVGYACGYYTSVSIFGSPATVRGCGQTIPPGTAGSASPSVSLPSAGSTMVISKTDRNGARAQYGPAYLFSGQDPDPSTGAAPPSGALKVTTTGTSTVTSTATVSNVGPNTFTADKVFATCTASSSSQTGKATITNGVVVTSTDADGGPVTSVAVPHTPPSNYTVRGTVDNVGDRFKVVFNEHITNPDGSLTENAAHMYLLGPTAVGDLVIAQTKCGV